MQVFVSSRRVSVSRELDTWVLRLARVRPGDSGHYSCHLNRPGSALSLSLSLEVKGKPSLSWPSLTSLSVPRLTPLDGWGRQLTYQNYHLGSAIEIACKV